MEMAKNVFTIFTIMALFGSSMAAEYTVGDSAGWTTKGNIDYKKWADGKQFQVGDTIVFKYNKEMHDVKEVSQNDYQSCNAASPIASYTSGSDSVTLKSAGHHFFLCGIPGHCQQGQKVDIMVSGSPSPDGSPASAPGASQSPSGSPSSSPGTSTSSGSTPTASPSIAPSHYSSNKVWLASALLAFSLAGFAF